MKIIALCTPKSLPSHLLIEAARTAVAINPHNHPPVEHLMRIMPGLEPTPERIAMVTEKILGDTGVRLTVSIDVLNGA
jgi:hypothetical protein